MIINNGDDHQYEERGRGEEHTVILQIDYIIPAIGSKFIRFNQFASIRVAADHRLRVKVFSPIRVCCRSSAPCSSVVNKCFASLCSRM